MSRSSIIRTLVISSSAVWLAWASLGWAADSGQPVAPADQKAAQAAKDLEHNMVQEEGLNHPREVVKGAGAKAAPKGATKGATKATKSQRDLDLEHDMVRGEGVNHPRQKASGSVEAPQPAQAAPKKTQTDADREHDQLQSDGTYHPREIIKK